MTNRSGEAFYLRDTDTGDLWCPTAQPRRDPAATYVARHGQGICTFDRIAYGIASSLVQYVPAGEPGDHRGDDPVKLSRLHLHNLSGRARTLTVSAYVEWVLGNVPHAPRQRSWRRRWMVMTGAMFARNPWGAAAAAARRLRRPARRRKPAGPGTGASSSAATAHRTVQRGPPAPHRCPAAWAPGWTRAARCRPPSTCRLAPRAEVVFVLGEAADADGGPHPGRQVSHGGPGCRAGRGPPAVGRRCWAQCRCGRPTGAWTSC